MSQTATFVGKNSLGLPLGLEAPVMTPDGVILLFLFFSFFLVGVNGDLGILERAQNQRVRLN